MLSASHAVDAPDVMATFAAPQFVELPQGRLAYYRFGQGPDVVLLHGWPVHAATFRHVIPALAARYTLHLFDLPGTGHSTAWSGPIDLWEHPATVRAAIDRLGLGRFALLAHDSGGAVARMVAADDPRVAALVLAGTEIPHHAPALVVAYSMLARIPGLARLVLLGMRSGALRRSALGFGGVFTDPAYADGEFRELFIAPLIADPRGQLALIRSLRFRQFDKLVEVHARIAAPVLCIWGTDDPFFPIAKARAMLPQFAGGAELVEIPRGKLFTHEDHPDAFRRHALAFLDRRFAH